MPVLPKAILLLSGVAAFAAVAPAFAQDTPVERPSVARPALPQASQDPPAPVEKPATAHPAPAQASNAPPRERSSRGATGFTGGGASNASSAFLYLGAGLGVVDGLSGGPAFERSNPALTGLVGVDMPLRGAASLGFELALDAELPGSGDPGWYAAALLRARLAYLLTPRTRVWGALGVGRAGYLGTSLAGALAAGGTLMFAPKFGLDLSANLSFVGASEDRAYPNAGAPYRYEGGAVLLVALKAMFELHKTR